MKNAPKKISLVAAENESDDDAPNSQTDPSKDDGDENEDGDEKDLAACAEACRAASTACADAQEKLDAAAEELEAGTDSVSSLTAAEQACAEAQEKLDDASSKCQDIRGAGTTPSADAPASPKAPAPAPTSGSSVPTVRGHIEIAQFAALGRAAMLAVGMTDPVAAVDVVKARMALAADVMTKLGQKDPVRARGVLGARLERATKAEKLEKQLAAQSVESDASKREKLWEDAIGDGRVKLAQAFTREEKDSKAVRVYAKWATSQNAAYPELAAFEGWIDSLPRGAHAAEGANPSTALADNIEDAASVTKRVSKSARRAGIDPELLANVLKANQRGAVSTDQEGT